jgi:pimeloyl-ACP methyl ester carboxylesterase
VVAILYADKGVRWGFRHEPGRRFITQPYDGDLSRFEADGAAPLPVADDQGYIERDGARIWYATYGSSSPVILLHGGLGHSGNWGYQVPALVGNGYRAVLVDSRGHGRSTRDAQPFSYELMASDVLAVMDTLHLEKASLVGWSDGACTALILAAKAPTRVSGVFFFGCNMDPSGVKPFEATPTLNRCFARHAKDYAQLSATPEHFKDFVDAVTRMQQTQPNYSAGDLAEIRVPVVIVHSEHDEFIKREHAEYLARSIPNAELVVLNGVSHFAPLQRPEQFNGAMLAFLSPIHGTSPLIKEHGVWVLHTGQPLPASAADEALEQERKERDRANRGDGE